MSVTYKVASQASIERAIKKAQQVKPHVKVNGYNDFTVTGSKGDSYQVHFSGKGADFTAHCTCTGSTNGRVCYHAASAAPVFKQQVNERAAQVAPAPSSDFSDLFNEIDHPKFSCRYCHQWLRYQGDCLDFTDEDGWKHRDCGPRRERVKEEW